MRRSLSSKAERSIFIELILLIEPIIFSSSLVGFSKSSQAFCSSFDIENNSIFLFNLFSASCIFINNLFTLLRLKGFSRNSLTSKSRRSNTSWASIKLQRLSSVSKRRILFVTRLEIACSSSLFFLCNSIFFKSTLSLPSSHSPCTVDGLLVTCHPQKMYNNSFAQETSRFLQGFPLR